MKTTTTLATSLMTALLTVTASAGEPAAAATTIAPEPSGSVLDSIHLFGTARLRYEHANFDKAGVGDANLFSLRARLGVKTDSIYGFKFLVEGEGTAPISKKQYYGAFPPPNNNGRAVIADPESYMLNRLQLSYTAEQIDTTVTVGRQYITLADQRFIGAIGWRQNDQTFDGAVLKNNSIENLNFTYAYISQVNRIFGSNAPVDSLEYWESNSHLVHLDYAATENLTLRGFAYLLRFDNSALNSTDTYGVELQGDSDILASQTLNYLVTVATQTDAGDNFNNYQEYYLRGQVGAKNDCYNYGLGAECMTSDGEGGRFLFPLGTNHKFNGFADAFLTTPYNGLVDYYGWIGAKLFTFNHTVGLHYYTTQHDRTDLGWEVDYVAARNIGENTKVVIKGAYYDGRGFDGQKDMFGIVRASAEVNVTF